VLHDDQGAGGAFGAFQSDGWLTFPAVMLAQRGHDNETPLLLLLIFPSLAPGRVPMMFENLAVMTPHTKKGSLRPLAVSSAKRTHLMPEVPTVAETGMGLEGFEVLGWFALLAPAKTPANVVQLLNAELNKMIAKPQIVARFADLGAEPLGGTPERATAFIREEQDKWGRIIREVGIKLN